MNFTDFEQILSMGDDGDTLMMLVWIIPIVIFVFYGQQIQLLVTSGEIKKAIKKLDKFSSDSKKELIDYVKKNLEPIDEPTKKIEQFLDYFTIMPVDMDSCFICFIDEKIFPSRIEPFYSSSQSGFK